MISFSEENEKKGLPIAELFGGATPSFVFYVPILFGCPRDKLVPASPEKSWRNLMDSSFESFERPFQGLGCAFETFECAFQSIERKNHRDLSAFPIGCEKRFSSDASLFVGQPREKAIPVCSTFSSSTPDQPRQPGLFPRRHPLSGSPATLHADNSSA